MKTVLDAAKSHPEYHQLYAYKNGKRVGGVYALEHEGYVIMDDLWVDEEYRQQRIATTLMKYVADHTDGIIFLHAVPSETIKEMYAKMAVFRSDYIAAPVGA